MQLCIVVSVNSRPLMRHCLQVWLQEWSWSGEHTLLFSHSKCHLLLIIGRRSSSH